MTVYCFEGTDGVGKSSFYESIKSHLATSKKEVEYYFCNETNPFIYQELLKSKNEEYNPNYHYLLSLASNIWTQNNIVRTVEAAEGNVIMDRSIVSAIVYSSCFGVDKKNIEQLSRLLSSEFKIVYIDSKVETSLKRKKNLDLLETGSSQKTYANFIDFQSRLKKTYVDYFLSKKDLDILYIWNDDGVPFEKNLNVILKFMDIM